MKVLVTGGCGYVGSNIVTALGEHGYEIGILDNLATSSVEIVEDLRTKIDPKLAFFETDVTDAEALKTAVKACSPDVVIHCAGLKSIADSWQDPLGYFETNVSSDKSPQGHGLCRLRAAYFRPVQPYMAIQFCRSPKPSAGPYQSLWPSKFCRNDYA